MNRKRSIGYIFNAALVGLLALLCVLPLWLVFVVSITDSTAIQRYGYRFFPQELSLRAYEMIFSPTSSLPLSYLITIGVTLFGTTVALLMTAMAAYTLSNPAVKKGQQLGMFFFVPMVFNAGLVPWYLVCTKLGLRNNIWALIVPSLLFSQYNMFLCRNFMKGLPHELMESARLDGANDLTIAFRIYFPLSKPVMATLVLFYAIAYWNDWFNAVMLVDNQKLFPLQYSLYKIQSEISALQRLQPGVPIKKLPGESMKMATAIATIGPIILLYPFLQKYFIKGLIIGGVKG